MRTWIQGLQLGTLRVLQWVAGAVVLAMLALAGSPAAATTTTGAKPTILLVHGAFAESSSWEGAVALLLQRGYPVVAAANPLRGVRADSVYVGNILDSIQGPVVLVGHSYGGNVISSAAVGRGQVRALVYAAAFAPEAGESAASLSTKYPGSTLGETLGTPVALPDGGKDLYIQQSRYHEQFAADLPANIAALLAASQRPITEEALNEVSGTPAWKTIPSWFIYGTGDKNIPPTVHAFMARRAHSRHTMALEGASHLVIASHPEQLADLIEEAAAETEQVACGATPAGVVAPAC